MRVNDNKKSNLASKGSPEVALQEKGLKRWSAFSNEVNALDEKAPRGTCNKNTAWHIKQQVWIFQLTQYLLDFFI